jgi:hypothetical protein
MSDDIALVRCDEREARDHAAVVMQVGNQARFGHVVCVRARKGRRVNGDDRGPIARRFPPNDHPRSLVTRASDRNRILCAPDDPFAAVA